MLAKVSSAAVLGVDAFEVQVEIDISGGLPSFMVVGLPDAAVQESRERVRSAVRNSGFPFPASRIVVNLAPADVRKEGPAFDLPIAIAVLVAQGVISQQALENTVISGELALNGKIRPIKGAINIALYASQANLQRVLVPPDNAAEAAIFDDIEVYAPETLLATTEFLQGRREINSAKLISIDTSDQHLDMHDVKGQTAAKRALEISAAGAHNLLLTGPPGSGKTMLARRLPGLLPPLRREEAIEVTRIHSTAGVLQNRGLIQQPVFRAPHHTVSNAGLIGGGTVPKPGEVSLAHHGILFLDEFPEFPRNALEALRQPLEDSIVTISRARASLTFPASFILIASQNPCPCGYYGDTKKECTCSPTMRQRYRERISGPLLDRIDLRLTVPRLSAEDLLNAPQGELSESIRQRVLVARNLSVSRQGIVNSQLSGQILEEHASLEGPAENFARSVVKQLALSGRGFDRLRKVSRTIADLAGAKLITESHVAEAVSYREVL